MANCIQRGGKAGLDRGKWLTFRQDRGHECAGPVDPGGRQRLGQPGATAFQKFESGRRQAPGAGVDFGIQHVSRNQQGAKGSPARAG